MRPGTGLYNAMEYDWAKGSEKGRQSCGFSRSASDFVIIDVPIKVWVRPDAMDESQDWIRDRAIFCGRGDGDGRLASDAGTHRDTEN